VGPSDRSTHSLHGRYPAGEWPAGDRSGTCPESRSAPQTRKPEQAPDSGERAVAAARRIEAAVSRVERSIAFLLCNLTVSFAARQRDRRSVATIAVCDVALGGGTAGFARGQRR